MAIEHRHPRCVTPSGGIASSAPTEALVIAELRREVGDLKLKREADADEASATYDAMTAELARAEEYGRNEVQRANDTTDYVVAERDARISQLERLVDTLRCGDLGLFFDQQLSPDRAAAFRLHLATCTRCDAGLLDLAQSEASMKSAKSDPTRGG